MDGKESSVRSSRHLYRCHGFKSHRGHSDCSSQGALLVSHYAISCLKRNHLAFAQTSTGDRRESLRKALKQAIVMGAQGNCEASYIKPSQIAARLLPKRVKSVISSRPFYHKLTAWDLAVGKKRLDLVAAGFSNSFHRAGFSEKTPVRGKVCLEIGCGWVLSDALVMHLLGAKKVIATDIQRMAYPEYLYRSIHASVDHVVLDVLSSFDDRDDIRSRLRNLFEIGHFSEDSLSRLGIEYVAPIDLARQSLETTYDFVYSTSVLEHVPKTDVPQLLGNLARSLSVGGIMLHHVHLEDHQDSQDHPFDFLSEPEELYTKEIETVRGNRIRASQWREMMSSFDGVDCEFFIEWPRKDKPLPKVIDKSVSYTDETDLRTSHLGILVEKRKGG